MNLNNFNLFLKMIREEYKLSEAELETLAHRLLADEKEFERVWRLFINKSSRVRDGVDQFKFTLQELIA